MMDTSVSVNTKAKYRVAEPLYMPGSEGLEVQLALFASSFVFQRLHCNTID